MPVTPPFIGRQTELEELKPLTRKKIASLIVIRRNSSVSRRSSGTMFLRRKYTESLF
jgi:hypothetical protein